MPETERKHPIAKGQQLTNVKKAKKIVVRYPLVSQVAMWGMNEVIFEV